MLQRERSPKVGGLACMTADASDEQQQWRGVHYRIPAVDMYSGALQTLYVQRVTGAVCRAAPPVPEQPAGGILCEEMGLGKVRVNCVTALAWTCNCAALILMCMQCSHHAT